MDSARLEAEVQHEKNEPKSIHEPGRSLFMGSRSRLKDQWSSNQRGVIDMSSHCSHEQRRDRLHASTHCSSEIRNPAINPKA